MGNDGGSIPTRRELVKTSARAPTASELKATALESLAHAWTTCHLTEQPLPPTESTVLASDWAGRIYSYEALLTALAQSQSQSQPSTDAAGHDRLAALGVRSLRDLVRLQVKLGPTSESNILGRREGWVCPVSMKALGASTRAVYLVPCGHVFAEVAVREVLGQEGKDGGGREREREREREGEGRLACPECSEGFAEDDVIPVLSAREEDMARLKARREALRAKGLTHSLKKDKAAGEKKKKKKRKAEEGQGEKEKTDRGEGRRNGVEKKDDKRVSGINNPLAASLTAKVLAEQDDRNKRRKMGLH